MEVSRNRGTPKWMALIWEKPYWNGWFRGTHVRKPSYSWFSAKGQELMQTRHDWSPRETSHKVSWTQKPPKENSYFTMDISMNIPFYPYQNAHQILIKYSLFRDAITIKILAAIIISWFRDASNTTSSQMLDYTQLRLPPLPSSLEACGWMPLDAEGALLDKYLPEGRSQQLKTTT